MIVVWGLLTDTPVAMVRDQLRMMGKQVFELDQARLLETDIELESDGVHGRLVVGSEAIELKDVESVYVRPYDVRRLPFVVSAPRHAPQWRHATRLEEQLGKWIEATPAKVVNRPSDMASNNAKPYQCEELRKAGFRIPETLLTNDASEALAFFERHSRIIYKSISGVRSVVTRFDPDDDAALERLRWCPTQFQQFISGDDYRVHVVGDEIFATRIVAAADDYRYAAGEVDLRACTLPRQVELACVKAARQLRLAVTGLDLRCTPEDQWYAFEANPSPGFSYYERATGQPIANSVARWLARSM